jgi:hypothetical protein
MVVIKRLRDVRPTNLANDAEGARILDNPIGRASLRDGPTAETCATCASLEIDNSVWSDYGVAAACGEHRRLRNGKVAQPIPASWPACDRYRRRPGAVDSILNAANFDTRIIEARKKVDRLRFALDRARDELAEIERQRREVSTIVSNAKDAGATDGASDHPWRPFAPFEPEKTE